MLPGGWAPQLLAGLTPAGAAALEAYVRGGGGVLAICASAYLAAAEGRWEGSPTLADPWTWLPARAVGPQTDLAPWPERAPVRLTRIDGEHPLQGDGQLDACYFGGPALELRDGAHALLRYPNGGVAGAACTAGQGRVVVLGPHLEVGPSEGQAPPQATTRLLASYLRWIARQSSGQ